MCAPKIASIAILHLTQTSAGSAVTVVRWLSQAFFWLQQLHVLQSELFASSSLYSQAQSIANSDMHIYHEYLFKMKCVQSVFAYHLYT